MECLLTLGQVCVEQGKFAAAEDVFRRLARLAEEQGDSYVEAGAWYGLTRVAIERLSESPDPKRAEEVRSRARRALALAEASGRSGVAAKSHWVLGVLLPGSDGLAHLDACTKLATTDRDHSYCLNALARHLSREDPGRAATIASRSLELAREAQDSWSQASAWREMMRVRWAEGSSEEAVADSWAALDAIERLRDLQGEGSEVQAGLFSTWADDYSWFGGQLVRAAGSDLDQTFARAEAFQVEERARARALTDWLRRTTAKSEAAEQGEAGAPRASGEGFASLDRVQAALAPDEALLSFQVAPWKDLAGDFGGGSWLMTVTKQGVTVHRLPGRTDVRRAVRLFEGLVERRDGSEAGPGTHLYQTLLAPALAELPPEVTRLILVPDDALHRLPFAALRPKADGVPFGERFELVRVPSATLWLRWRDEEPPRPEQPVLVLADPTLGGVVPSAPVEDGGPPDEPGPAATGSRLAQARGGDGVAGAPPEETFGPLVHAREEGRAAIRDLGGGLLLAGSEATESRLASLDLTSFGLLHFAAHAVTDEDRPERSAVLLAADRAGQGPGHDGRLESGEIARLHLGGRTVVLASCRSADGTVLRGEGVMSLARAFFQAGAHGVVASLWPLRDDESAALFERFYRHLAAGETVAGALHEARREAIAAGEPAAAWAGLVVLGDGALVPVPGGRRIGLSPTLVAVVLGVLALLAALGIGLRHRRGRRPAA